MIALIISLSVPIIAYMHDCDNAGRLVFIKYSKSENKVLRWIGSFLMSLGMFVALAGIVFAGVFLLALVIGGLFAAIAVSPILFIFIIMLIVN